MCSCLSFPPSGHSLCCHGLALLWWWWGEIWGGGRRAGGPAVLAGSRHFGAAPARPHPFASRAGAQTNGTGTGSRAGGRGHSGAEAPCSPVPQLAGTGRVMPTGPPVPAVPSPAARWRRLSLSSPLSFPPSFPLRFLLLFLASRPLLHSKVVTNFQLRPGEPNGAENAPNLQPGRPLGSPRVRPHRLPQRGPPPARCQPGSAPGQGDPRGPRPALGHPGCWCPREGSQGVRGGLCSPPRCPQAGEAEPGAFQ